LARFVGPLARHPARTAFAWYAVGLIAGSAVLLQPFCRTPAATPLTFIDAIFTATSALCVTGLSVRSTGNEFSWFGQLTVLLLIQLGGIGIITVTTFVTLRLGGRQSLHNRTLLAETLGTSDEPDLSSVLRRVVRFTLLFELGGAVILTLRFLFDYHLLDALWHGIFHSVSAFCNAGFSLNDNSLMAYQGDWIVNLTIMTLIICGGIGYPVMIDVSRNWHRAWPECWSQLMLHTKLMLIGTAVLIALGTIAVLVFESQHLLREMPLPRQILVALFQSVTSRTAGFNTIDTGALQDATLLVVILLMLVGAGPCSAAGGFKVTTLCLLALRAWTTFWGGSQVHMARRTIPQEVIDRAVTTALLFAATLTIGLTLLLSLEQLQGSGSDSGKLFVDASFEAASALGTVGLSTGFTAHLTTAGKIVIILLMFIGRLGPITVIGAISLSRREPAISYATEEPLVG